MTGLDCRRLTGALLLFTAGTSLAACGSGAKDVVKEYLNQKDCADRASFILDPEKNKTLMLDYYKSKNVTQCVTKNEGIEDGDCEGKKDGEYCVVSAKGINQRYELKKVAGSFKVDFRASYGYGPDTLKRLEAEIAAGARPRAFLVRVTAKLERRGNEGDIVLLSLREETGTSVTARVYTKLPDGAALVKALIDGNEHRIMVTVGAAENTEGIDAYRLVQEGWRQRDDETAPPPLLPASMFVPAASAPADSPRPSEPSKFKDAVIAVEKPRVEGKLPPEVVERVLRGRVVAVRRCYEDGLRNDGDLKGRISAKLKVDAAGAVVGVEDAGSDLPAPKVLSCVFDDFKALSFPASGNVVTIAAAVSLKPH